MMRSVRTAQGLDKTRDQRLSKNYHLLSKPRTNPDRPSCHTQRNTLHFFGFDDHTLHKPSTGYPARCGAFLVSRCSTIWNEGKLLGG